MSDLYRIKPLVWGQLRNDWHECRTLFGTISIRDYDRLVLCLPNSDHTVGSVEDGKAKAEQWYRAILLTALEKVDE